MKHIFLPIIVVGLTAALTWGAIEFLPETLYFPQVEYSTPQNVRFSVLMNGELDRATCEQSAKQIIQNIRANCADCQYVNRCFRGLDAERRRILSREPLPIPTTRRKDGRLTLTISAKEPALALAVCQLLERQSALLPYEKRLQCFPAFANR